MLMEEIFHCGSVILELTKNKRMNTGRLEYANDDAFYSGIISES